MQDQIYDMLMKKDEVTWQSILYDLVKSEQMDPWDIDITKLSQRYIETVQKLQETNFYVSGKMILAAAILLKLKSEHLVNKDLAMFDSKLFYQEPTDLQDLESAGSKYERMVDLPQLTIRTPQARKRKVSISDLVVALDRALRVSQRKEIKRQIFERPQMSVPAKKIDISSLIKDVYEKVVNFFKEDKTKKLKFSQLIPSERKEDKIVTFLPLLHLSNEEKVGLYQEKHFEDFDINLLEEVQLPAKQEDLNTQNQIQN